jgi:putative flavoprotein involved in K+ transport
MAFPARPHTFPSKDEMADYLEAYAARFELPVRTGVRVDRVARNGRGFTVSSGKRQYGADNVVVAMGTYQKPKLPDFAAQLNHDIVQLHAKDYRNPAQLRQGGVLVVGVGNSGAEIALDVSRAHPTWLSGDVPGFLPFSIEGPFARFLFYPLLLPFLGDRLLSLDTPLGRKARPRLLSKGDLLWRSKPKDFAPANIRRVSRTVGAKDGLPLLEDGQTLEIGNIIWSTGFKPDFSWIDLPVFGEGDKPIEPIHERGVIAKAPGLYFVGLKFLYSLSSGVIKGVGRDAEYVVRDIAKRMN